MALANELVHRLPRAHLSCTMAGVGVRFVRSTARIFACAAESSQRNSPHPRHQFSRDRIAFIICSDVRFNATRFIRSKRS